MSDEQREGYRGKVLEVIRKAGAVVGDIITVTKETEILEGTLIPRSEYEPEDYIVIKLKNGYNVGIRLANNVKIARTGRGMKPTFTSLPPPEQNLQLPRVTVLSTGGTIASRVDYRTGAVRPALTASDLYNVVPELSKIARIDAKIVFSLFSENITVEDWTEIAKAVEREINNEVDGVVVAHGTDTMGYTAAAMSFALQNLPVPVVFVGSQRSADRPSSDAATNLIGAVSAAANAKFAEVAVAMHENSSDDTIIIHRGTRARKCHTSRRDAFKSVNTSPLAVYKNQEVIMLTKEYKKRDPKSLLKVRSNFDKNVSLLKYHPSMDPSIIDWFVDKGYRGLIIEGSGLGHVGKLALDSLKKAIEKRVIVGMTSQCIWGRVNMNVYDTGRDLLALGVIPLEDMLPETALVKLMWVLGQTTHKEKAEEMLKKNLVGEFSARTLP